MHARPLLVIALVCQCQSDKKKLSRKLVGAGNYLAREQRNLSIVFHLQDEQDRTGCAKVVQQALNGNTSLLVSGCEVLLPGKLGYDYPGVRRSGVGRVGTVQCVGCKHARPPARCHHRPAPGSYTQKEAPFQELFFS